MFGLMPAYGMVEAGRQPPPLTSGQKFKLAVQYLNPYTFVFVAAEAGVNQARNSPKEYGQGAEGLRETIWRWFCGWPDATASSLLASIPLFCGRTRDTTVSAMAVSPTGMGYAVSRILVTRQDSGRKAFNFSEVLGSFSSSALAMTYYPKSQRDFSDVAERAGIQFAFDAGFNVLKEFYPEIERKIFRRKRKH